MTGFLVCVQPRWPLLSGFDVFLGNFGALGLIARSAFSSFREGPQWALGGGIRDQGLPAQGCVEGEGGQGRLSFKGVGCFSPATQLWGAPGRHRVPASWVLPAACVPRSPLTFVLIRLIPFSCRPLPPALALNPSLHLPPPIPPSCKKPGSPICRDSLWTFVPGFPGLSFCTFSGLVPLLLIYTHYFCFFFFGNSR